MSTSAAAIRDTLDREISDSHLGTLRTAIGKKDGESLPPKLEEKYWELKRIFDRVGAPLGVDKLCWLVFLHGHGKPTEKEKAPPTVVEIWRKGEIALEAAVQVKFRNKWCDAVLKGVTSNDEVTAQIVDDPESRRFKDGDVRVRPEA